jgi:hypothetical protein
MTDSGRLVRTFLYYSTIPILIGLNWFLFRYVGNRNYFLWYLDNGAVIGLATGLLGLFWALEKRAELISVNPVEYFATCLQVSGGFLFSMGTYYRTPEKKSAEPKESVRTIVADLWDTFASLCVVPLIVAVALLWVAVVAPLNYLVTLIGGAPARRSLRHGPRRLVAMQRGSQTEMGELSADAPLPRDAIEVSFAAKPFAAAQAVNALVLWIARELYARFA